MKTNEEQQGAGSIKVNILTDELIDTYAMNNVINQYRDIDLKVKVRIDPYPHGVYDQEIFGSIFADRCNCGLTKTKGVRCPRCGATVLSEVEAFKRFGKIELPLYYTTNLKRQQLIKFLQTNFGIQKDLQSSYYTKVSWSSPKVLDICQWEYDEDHQTLTITDNITDFRKCSYEGLFEIIRTHKPDLLAEYRAYINNKIIVLPVIIRAPEITIVDGSKVLKDKHLTTVYKNIIYCAKEYYPQIFPTLKSESGKAIFRGSLRNLITTSLNKISRLQQSSKENLARSMQSNRIANSGRSVIVPDSSLPADQVKIPRHLMYELCKTEFIEYLQDKMKIDKMTAMQVYTQQATSDEVQKLFTEYVEGTPGKDDGKYVLINRAPTLYEYGMATVKCVLTNDYVMKIPQTLCKPFNADFDGDEMAFYAIPKKMNHMMNDVLSPRNRFRYRKSYDPMNLPMQDQVLGLTLATKATFPDKIQSFDSIEDMREEKRKNPEFKYQTVVSLNGEHTTLGREEISEIVGKNITAYTKGIDKPLTTKNIPGLLVQMEEMPDRLDRIQRLYEFASKIATLSGSTSIRLTELYLDIDEKYLKKMKAIENDPKLDEKAKEVMIRDIYKEFSDEQLKKIPEGLQTMISETGHARITELRDLAIPRLTVGPNGIPHLGESTLSGGMKPIDYERYSIETRGVQVIKNENTPQTGYLTRQFIYLASEYLLVDGEDSKNPGIFINANRAEGRTGVDGKLIPKTDSTDLIKVRSLVTSTLGRGKITADMISSIMRDKVGSRAGMALISAATEGITQSALALKHGGNLFILRADEELHAPDAGTLEVQDKYLIFHGANKQDYKYPKPADFVQNQIKGGKYTAGDKIGVNYIPVTPAHITDSVIQLVSAKSTQTKTYLKNRKIKSECYVYEDGVVDYREDTCGNIKVFVGDIEYQYNPDAVYYHPAGTSLKKLDRLCSGTLDMSLIFDHITDMTEGFYFFNKQFLELLTISSDLIEFIYSLLVHKREDGQIEIQSVMNNIYGSNNFFKSLAFGDSRKTFNRIDYKGVDLVPDPLTQVILSLIVNNTVK